MKITVMGFVTLVVAMVLLGLVVYQVAADIDKNRQKNNEQPHGLF